MTRRIAYTVSVVVVVVAALIVPLPLVELAPGTTTSVEPLVALRTDDTTPIEGRYELLTVLVRTPTFVDTVGAWLSPTRELDRRDQMIPTGIDERDYFRLQRQQFERSFRIAVAVGLRAAGHPVEVTTRPLVFSVLPGGPSGGVLAPGDLVTAVEGVEVTSGADLVALLENLQPGDDVTLTIERGDQPETVTVTAGRIAGLDRAAGIGITIETIANDVELPFDVGLDEHSGIGGPSAGLLFALAVYDLVNEEDLAAGRVIAGTGTVDVDGRIGAVGGIIEKVAAAELARADVLLVPASQVRTAEDAAGGDLRVVGVGTFAEALEALRDAG